MHGLIFLIGALDLHYFAKQFFFSRKDVTSAFFTVSFVSTFVGSFVFYHTLWFRKRKLLDFIQATSCTPPQRRSDKHRIKGQVLLVLFCIASHGTALLHSLFTGVKAREAAYIYEILQNNLASIISLLGGHNLGEMRQQIVSDSVYFWIGKIIFSFLITMMIISIHLFGVIVLTMHAYARQFIENVTRNSGNIPQVRIQMIFIKIRWTVVFYANSQLRFLFCIGFGGVSSNEASGTKLDECVQH